MNYIAEVEKQQERSALIHKQHAELLKRIKHLEQVTTPYAVWGNKFLMVHEDHLRDLFHLVWEYERELA